MDRIMQHDVFKIASDLAPGVTPHKLYDMYTQNLLWNLFLTSTACHAVVLITSPLQAVVKWYTRNSSDSDSAIPYLCGVVGSLLWLRYAIFIHDVKLILLQSYAVVMQTFFVLTITFYRSRKKRLIRVALMILTSMTALFLYVNQMSHGSGKILIGRLASSAQIAGSLICPYFIYKAVTTKVIDFIPLAPVIFTWVMELHAIVYSIGIDDYYMLLANSVFCIMDGSLLTMFFIYPREKPSRQPLSKVNIL